jgi:uncharacterized protein YjbI with pentapeptide repeats
MVLWRGIREVLPMRNVKLRSSRVAAVVALVAAFLLGTATYGAVEVAGASGTTTTYYACLSQSGALSRVGTAKPTPAACKAPSKVISWNSQGPAGPKGETGPKGAPGTNGVTYDCSVAPYVGADLAGCDLTDESLAGVHIYGADLVEADMDGVYLAGADLTGANMSGAQLVRDSGDHSAILAEAKLNGANLTNATMQFVDLSFASLIAANLTGADLTDANRSDSGEFQPQTNLTDANLTNADVSGADLEDSNLTGTNLSDSYVEDTDLTDANLTGANLTDAEFAGTATLTGVTWSGTICPDGTNSDQDGGTCVSNLNP